MLRSYNFTTFVPVILRTFSHPPAWEPNVLLFDYLFYQNDVFSPNLLRLAVDSSYFETRMMRFSKSSNRTRFKWTLPLLYKIMALAEENRKEGG